MIARSLISTYGGLLEVINQFVNSDNEDLTEWWKRKYRREISRKHIGDDFENSRILQ